MNEMHYQVAEPGDATHYEFMYGEHDGEMLIVIVEPSKSTFTVPLDFKPTGLVAECIADQTGGYLYTIAAVLLAVAALRDDPNASMSVMLGVRQLWQTPN